MLPGWTRRVRLVGINLLVLATLLIVIEGLASYRYFVDRVLSVPSPESVHTQYDAELGWAHIPSTRLPDFYGPAKTLSINSQGLREPREIDPLVAPGRTRVICSGDSFTFGHGVGDTDTWCHQLMAGDPTWETVNMGQSAYGVDQAYLWYKRDGGRWAHHLQVFAFILEDFARASSAQTQFPKPLLIADHGSLRVTGTPVPGPRQYWVRRINDELEQLRSADLARRLGRLLRAPAARKDATADETKAMFSLLLEDLQRLNRARSSRLVLVHLPVDGVGGDPNQWLPFVDQEARRLGIPYIDLLDAFRPLPSAALQSLFIADDVRPWPAASGHYTAAGHAFVADLLRDRLKPLMPRP